METAVKERLVGAVVLVGVIVALVPEMLSGPRRATTTDAAPNDGAVRTFTIDLTLPAASPGTEPAESAGDAGDSESVQGTAVDAHPNPSPPDKEAPTSTGPAPTPVQPAASSSRSDAARVGAAVVDTGWAVQLGSFASRENAERLAAEIKRGGYRAFVSRFESGSRVRYRVRVGPEQDRSQAEALARRLQRDGRQVSIVSHP